MKRSELERAWPAAEPPPGFSDRVVGALARGERGERGEEARSQPAPRRARWAEGLAALGRRWLVLPALAVPIALAAVLLLWPARELAIVAAEPRVVALGERVSAELSPGARLRWSRERDGSGDAREVQQDSGAVTYRVVPGTPFRVHTPHGSVSVLGTVFRVAITDRDLEQTAGGEPMKKRWAMAGAGAALGALLVVSVERGSVALSSGEHELVVGAGQAASVGADGTPQLELAALAPAQAAGKPDAEAERQRARRVADAVRRHAARQREAARAAQTKPEPPPAPAPAEPSPPPVVFQPSREPVPSASPTPEESARRDYIRNVMREQYFPVARDCYEELLARQPTAGGRVTLEFAIVGDGDAGVVDRVELRDDTTIDDPEFVLCMRESMYTAVFEPPPPGTSETTVVYPVVLAPN